MIKKFTLLFFLIFAVCIGYVAAQDYQPENQPAQQPKESTELTGQMQNITGIVDKVDLEKKTITVKDAVTHEKKSFDFDTATSFSKENQPLTAGDLKKGDRASLAIDAQNMVTTIKVESTNPEKEKTEKPH